MKQRTIYISLTVAIVLLWLANITLGAVEIPLPETIKILLGLPSDTIRPSWVHIIRESRLPIAITALLSGSALAVSGLLLQTLFRNPLADPSILGVSSGANLGVAVVMLAFGGVPYIFGGSLFGGYMAIIIAALIGAALVLGVIIWLSARINSNTMLLIVGIMVGYIISSAISILNFQASSDKVHALVMWGMGDFTSVSVEKLPYFILFVAGGVAISILLIKPLNALLLGDVYAENLGVNIKRTRGLILLATGVLTATTTAFCGPISFIGLAVPHIARLMLGSSNHKSLLPVTILCGATIALLCQLLTLIGGGNQLLPLNSITPIIGAPVIIYVIMKPQSNHYLN